MVGCKMPLTICNSVLLPHPFGPPAQGFTAPDFEADVAQRPEIAVGRRHSRQQLAQPVGRTPIQTIQLGNVLNRTKSDSSVCGGGIVRGPSGLPSRESSRLFLATIFAVAATPEGPRPDEW